MALRKSSILAMDYGLCRLCNEIKKCRVINFEYDHSGQKEIYSTMLMDTFGILLLNLDGESSGRLVCAPCVVRLRAASAFKQQVLQCEERLLAKLHKFGHSSKLEVKIEEIHSMTTDTSALDDTQEDTSRVDDTQVDTSRVDDLEEDDSQMDVSQNSDWRIDQLNVDETKLDETESFYDLEVIEESILASDPEDSKDTSLHEMEIKEEPITKKPIVKKIPKKTEVKKPGVSCKKKSSLAFLNEPSKEVLLERMMKVKALMESRKNRSVPVKPVRLPPPIPQGKTKETFMQENTVTVVENSYVCPFNNITGNYYCYYCRTLFTDPAVLRQHTMTHNPKPYFQRNWSIRRAPKLDITRIDCRLCDKKIDNIPDLKSHLTAVHRKKFHNVSNEFLVFKLTYPEICCMECGEKFFFIDKLIDHMAEHFGKYICEQCGAAFVQLGSLQAHVRCHKKSSVKYPCHICGKELTTNRSRRVHISVVHEKKGVIDCHKCDEQFLSYDLRNKHMEKEHGLVRSIPCTLCDRKFENRKTFLNHMESRHPDGNTVYRCDICDKSFNVRLYFQKHMRNQHGVKQTKK